LSTIAKILGPVFFFRNKEQVSKFNKFKENIHCRRPCSWIDTSSYTKCL